MNQNQLFCMYFDAPWFSCILELGTVCMGYFEVFFIQIVCRVLGLYKLRYKEVGRIDESEFLAIDNQAFIQCIYTDFALQILMFN